MVSQDIYIVVVKQLISIKVIFVNNVKLTDNITDQLNNMLNRELVKRLMRRIGLKAHKIESQYNENPSYLIKDPQDLSSKGQTSCKDYFGSLCGYLSIYSYDEIVILVENKVK